MTDRGPSYDTNTNLPENNELVAENPEPPRTPDASSTITVIFPPELNVSFVSYLGEGAYGKVYLAQDEGKALRAVKTYDLKKMDQKYREKFIPRESDIILKISHPNIISTQKLYRSGTGTILYMVMSYAERKDLGHYMTILCTGTIQESRARCWIRQISNALEYLHTIGIVHRDIKCENILISGSLNAKLADFGFTRVMRSARDLSSTYCGTATYAAPEVIRNAPYNPRAADIWSLGVVLFGILNKTFPFGGPEVRMNERLRRQKAKEYTFNRNLDISVEVKQIISNMLEPNPRHRISAKEIQTHPWIFIDPSCRTTAAEEEAFKVGRAKGHFFRKENPRVRKITSLDPRVSILEESSEKAWPDNGEVVSEETVPLQVCQDIITISSSLSN